jgi:hypothetical protein
MSASVTTKHDFIEALYIKVPRELHPCAEDRIYGYFDRMREAVDDPALVVKLSTWVREAVAQELRWEAEVCDFAREFKEAYRLRRRADKFAPDRFEHG